MCKLKNWKVYMQSQNLGRRISSMKKQLIEDKPKKLRKSSTNYVSSTEALVANFSSDRKINSNVNSKIELESQYKFYNKNYIFEALLSNENLLLAPILLDIARQRALNFFVYILMKMIF